MKGGAPHIKLDFQNLFQFCCYYERVHVLGHFYWHGSTFKSSDVITKL